MNFPQLIITVIKRWKIRNDIIILIAEDDEGHFILAKRLLRKAVTNEIMWLRDGQETLDFLRMQGQGPRRDPQRDYLLLLDLRMPKIDGFEVLSQLQKETDLKGIPVIVITTSDYPDNISRCKALSCAGYAIKPLKPDFVDTLEQVAARY